MIQEPTQPVPTPGAAKVATRDNRRTGVIIALIVALAFPVVAIVAANAPKPSTQNLLGAGASASPDSAAKDGDPGRHGPKDGRGWKAFKLDKGGFGPGFGRGNAFGKTKGMITIRAISGSQVSLATEDGWSRTITATSDTVITKGGQTIAVGGLKVGDHVGFGQRRNDDGSYSITAIWVVVPKTGGEVTKVDGNQFTITGRGGITRVITVNGSTTYTMGDAAATKADVKVGTEIDAQGEASGDTFTAMSIEIELPHIAGVVTAKTANSITVKQRDGTSAVIHVNGKTAYKVFAPGAVAGSLADIAVGDAVSAEGSLRANGSLDATAVKAGKFKVKPFKGFDDDDEQDDVPG